MEQGFKKLIVWKKAYQLVLETYKATKLFPKEELFCLTSQIRRAVTSIPANIAEGYERHYRKEYIQFLMIAKGSLGEIETFFLLSRDLEYLSEEKFKILEDHRSEVARLLQGLIRSVSKD